MVVSESQANIVVSTSGAICSLCIAASCGLIISLRQGNFRSAQASSSPSLSIAASEARQALWPDFVLDPHVYRQHKIVEASC